MPRNLEHRGTSGSDPETGDGAGILTQIPDAFFRRECKGLGIELPPCWFLRGGHALRVRPRGGPRLRGISGEDRRGGGAAVPASGTCLRRRSTGRWRARSCRASGSSSSSAGTAMRTPSSASSTSSGAGSTRRSRRRTTAVVSLSSRKVIYKGLLKGWQLPNFYPDLGDPGFASAISLVHEPSRRTLWGWELAHPYRYVAHNGEINTLRGNVNWMRARESRLESPCSGRTCRSSRP